MEKANKKAIKKYFDKLKEQGTKRNHGTREQSDMRVYRFNAIKCIKYLFKDWSYLRCKIKII